jgi:hypothetical protein
MIMVRSDLFGFGDLLAFNGTNTDIIQSTTAENMSARIRKIKNSAEAWAWLANNSGRNIIVHGWQKVGNRWQVKELYLRREDLNFTVPSPAVPPPACVGTLFEEEPF